MKILPIQPKSQYKNESNSNKTLSTASNPLMPQRNELPNFYYPPVKNSPVFKGLLFQTNVVEKVIGKNFQGDGLYKKERGKWLDFSKVGWKNLSQESLDLKKATDNEIYAFWHALGFAETNDSTWVRRFNKYNVPAPLAVHHSLSSQKAQKIFDENLKELHDLSRHNSLDVPITDKNGNLCLDCSIFDTETTGLNIEGPKKPLDRIVQIGAIQVKNGKVIESSAYNQLLNPGMPIPEQVSKIHGITDEDVKDKPYIEAILKPFINNYLNKKNGVIVAYNSKFDITILNNAIDFHNGFSKDKLLQKKAFKVLDPFILIQRIHPYLGARKKLGEQYKFLFCKNLDDAHDAFADVKGTVNVMKYVLYKLSDSRIDKSKPLTLRDVLRFQNGEEVENIGIKLDHKGCNNKVNFDASYRIDSIAVDNYFKGYKLTGKKLKSMIPFIGPENAAKLKKEKITNHLVDLNPEDGYPINPAEMKLQPKNGGIENAFYVMNKNFRKVLEFAKLEAYGNNSKEDIIESLVKESEHYLHDDHIDIWVKNPNPLDIKEGNDLPDINIIRKVMSEEN